MTQVSAGWQTFFKGLRDLDLSGYVVLLLGDRDAAYLDRAQLDGRLVVPDDAHDLARRHTLSTRDPHWTVFGTGRQVGQEQPVLWISGEVADRILEESGHAVDELRRQAEHLGRDEVLDIPLDTTVSMQVEATIEEKIPIRHVIGHLPGQSGRWGNLDPQTIVVLAQYDSPPLTPEGAFYPGANDNASAVAVMTEIVRTMQETGYQPYRTFLFIAYSGEGLEGGEPVNASDVSKFLQAKRGFSSNLKVEAIVHLRGLGAGGDTLTLSAEGSRRLLKLFEDAAGRAGVRARPARDPVDISIVFEEKSRREGGQEAPEITVSWEGWEDTSRLPTDTVDTLSAEKLEQAGRALTLALMALGRELEY
jgi:hypothetical protein